VSAWHAAIKVVDGSCVGGDSGCFLDRGMADEKGGERSSFSAKTEIISVLGIDTLRAWSFHQKTPCNEQGALSESGRDTS